MNGKKTFYTELAYAFGIVILAVGRCSIAEEHFFEFKDKLSLRKYFE